MSEKDFNKENRPGDMYPSVENRSNTELLEEIDRIMEQGENMDVERVEYLLAVLQERAPVMEDYDPVKQWEKVQEDHPLFFTEDALDTVPTKKKVLRGNFFKKASRICQIAATLLLVIVITANAAGVNPVQAVIRWTDGVVQMHGDPSGVMELPAVAEGSAYKSLVEALIDAEIDPDTVPDWIPKDYSLSDVQIRQNDKMIRYSATYSSERGDLSIRVVRYMDTKWVSISEREDGGYLYQHNGIDRYVISNYELTKAGWALDDIVYSISGQITEAELLKMIDSINE